MSFCKKTASAVINCIEFLILSLASGVCPFGREKIGGSIATWSFPVRRIYGCIELILISCLTSRSGLFTKKKRSEEENSQKRHPLSLSRTGFGSGVHERAKRRSSDTNGPSSLLLDATSPIGPVPEDELLPGAIREQVNFGVCVTHLHIISEDAGGSMTWNIKKNAYSLSMPVILCFYCHPRLVGSPFRVIKTSQKESCMAPEVSARCLLWRGLGQTQRG
jgi:hypothetical protein